MWLLSFFVWTPPPPHTHTQFRQLYSIFCAAGLSNATGLVSAGHWALEGAREATPPETDNDYYGICRQGNYCPEGSTYPIPCSAGTYG